MSLSLLELPIPRGAQTSEVHVTLVAHMRQNRIGFSEFYIFKMYFSHKYYLVLPLSLAILARINSFHVG